MIVDWVLWGLWVILVTVMVQWFVASRFKAAAPGAVPGKISAELSHDSFVFRAHRTFQNSIENVPFFAAAVLLAILSGVQSQWFVAWVWLYAIIRIIHMVLYYAIATEKNPSPRSYFFIVGVVANIAVLVQAAMVLAGA
ncbi:MAPEG family protein [Pseudidiomarina sp. PP-1MA]|uniref:MAPEG family protein n=1 Tax=Pseudidiomarina sp. PP-1MA TaxID=3237706 RepID=A0AB39X9I6_9GAMM